MRHRYKVTAVLFATERLTLNQYKITFISKSIKFQANLFYLFHSIQIKCRQQERDQELFRITRYDRGIAKINENDILIYVPSIQHTILHDIGENEWC